MMRIAIIKPSALGDIVHTLPVLSAVRDQFPDAKISWVVNRAFAPLLHGHPDLNEVIPFDRGAYKSLRTSLNYSVTLLNELRKKRFQLVLDLQGLARTGLMTLATGAPVRIGFSNAREGSRWAYTHTVPVQESEEIHAVDRYWRMVDFLGAGKQSRRCIVPIDPAESTSVVHDFSAYPRPWIVTALGSKWFTKRWPPTHFAKLLQLATQQFGGTIFSVGTAEDSPLSLELQNHVLGTVVDLTGKTPLPRLAALLKSAEVMVANDTGPLHLAAALGTPCVAPYTCTKIALHGPYGQLNRAVSTTVDCAGSYLKKCPNNMICMNDLTPEKLWPQLHEVLQKWTTRIR
jgi:heptosyltransferase I